MGFQLPISSCVVEKRKANMSSIGRSTGDETERQITDGEKNNFAFQNCPHFHTYSHILGEFHSKVSARDFHPCCCQVNPFTKQKL